MKHLLGVAVIIFVSYIVYYDLQSGTIPLTKGLKETTVVKAEENSDPKGDHYRKVTVKPGDTVLSVVERIHNHSVKVSIETIVNDFESLNKGVSAEKIQIGKSYMFPMY